LAAHDAGPINIELFLERCEDLCTRAEVLRPTQKYVLLDEHMRRACQLPESALAELLARLGKPVGRRTATGGMLDTLRRHLEARIFPNGKPQT
jgi:hypothetical protein